MSVFYLSHLGDRFPLSIAHYKNTTLPVGSQFDMLYSSSMFSDLLNAWTDTAIVNQPVFVYGDEAGSSLGYYIMEDFATRMNQAWKLYFKIISNKFNDKKMKIYNNGKFVNPVNGNYFTMYEPYTNSVAFKVYDENDILLFTSTNFNVTHDLNINHIADLISWTDFEAFINAPTAADARQYFYVLRWYFAVDSGTDQHSCAFRIEHEDIISDTLWYLFAGENPETEPDDDPYSGDDSPYDPADTGGGDGDGENPYDPGDPNPFPDDPPFSIADSGLMSVYIPSNVQLNLLGAYLWSSNFFSSLVKDMYADAMDVILSLGVLPFNIPAAGSRNIMVGDRDSGVGSNYPSEKYHTLDCGSIHLGTTIGAYIDYAPYTKGDIYIPFVGMVPLDIDAFMGHDIGLKYKVEICTGAAVAFIMRDSDVWQTFACNLLTPIPLSGGNYSQMWQTVVSATAALAGAGAAGAAGMGAAATAGEAAEGAQAVSGVSGNAAKASSGIMSAAATKPSIQKSNNISVLAGILVNRKPFILLHRPNLMLPTDQNKLQGYPSYIKETLSNINGYSRVSSINLSVPGATAREINLIDSILKTGFIVGSGTNISGSGIVLGRNTSPTHQLNKQVTQVDILTGTFRDSVDILSPVVRIEYSNPVGFDYVYISEFGRYYYVEDITIVRTGILDLHLSIDVLESHKAAILANTAILDKQENKYNLYLNDDSIKMRQDPLVTCKVFPYGMFENNAFEYVLCVAGN